MATQEVTLQPNESKVVSFQAVPTEARTYQVTVDGLTGSFTATAAPPPPGVGNLLVSVKDATTGQPIAGATVAIYMTTISGMTDQNGQWQALNLPVGTYVVTVNASGYESFAANIQVVEGVTSLDVTLDPIPVVTPGTGVKRLRVRLVGTNIECEVTFNNETGQSYRLNIPNADFFYILAWPEELGFWGGQTTRLFRMAVGDIVPTGVSVWHGSAEQYYPISRAQSFFFQWEQSWRGILSSSWQDWEEIPYEPIPPYPGPEIPPIQPPEF